MSLIGQEKKNVLKYLIVPGVKISLIHARVFVHLITGIYKNMHEGILNYKHFYADRLLHQTNSRCFSLRIALHAMY